MRQASRRLSISRDEWFVIGSIFSLAIVLIGAIPSLMNSAWFTELAPPLQYFLYNIGFMLLTMILLGVPLSHALHQSIAFWPAFRSGLSSWLIFSFILDLWQPPFVVASNGMLLLDEADSLIGTSVDFMLNWVYWQIFSESTLAFVVFGNISFAFMLVYFITPLLAVIIAALLLKPGFLLRMFKQEVI